MEKSATIQHVDSQLDRSDLPLGLYASENYLTTIPDFRRRSDMLVSTESIINYGDVAQEHLAMEGGERVQKLEHVVGKDMKYPRSPEGYKDFGLLAADASSRGTLEETVMQDPASEVPLDRSRRNHQQMEERTSNFVPEERERLRHRSGPDEPLLPRRSAH